MKKLIILQGVPASGKSTWVKDYLNSLTEKERSTTVVVSRDNIRESTGTYWIPAREEYITEIEHDTIRRAMKRGYTVISDNTNLNPKSITKLESIAKEFNYEIAYNKFKISYKEALERDSKRERPVGKQVLKSFFMRYFEKEFREEMYVDRRPITYDGTLKRCIICDLDGTVAIHTSGRSPYEYERCEEDTCYEPLMRTLKDLYFVDVEIIFITGREQTSESKQHTISWLNKYFGGPTYTLFMRAEGDHRPGDVVKKEIYEKYVKGNYNVTGIYEDSNKCVKMWRSLGLPCYQVWELDD